jgi:hypothetical protein
VMSPPESFYFLFLFPLSPRLFLTKEKDKEERRKRGGIALGRALQMPTYCTPMVFWRLFR